MKTTTPMDRHRLPARRALARRLTVGSVVAAALAGVAVAAGATLAAAAATPPELRVRISERCDKVIIAWRFSDDGRQRDRTLEIQRASTGAFTTVVTRDTPSRRGQVSDPVCPDATLRYRARLVTHAGGRAASTLTDWGPVVTVTPADARPTTTTRPPRSSTTSVAPTTETTTPPSTVPPPAGVHMCPESWDDRVIADVNAFRAQHHLAPIRPNARLGAAADRRAADLAALGRLDNHAGYQRAVQDAGYSYWWVGEWLHWYIPVDRVVGGWIGSAPHRDALLWTFYSEVGIGCASGPRGGPFWSMIAGAP